MVMMVAAMTMPMIPWNASSKSCRTARVMALDRQMTVIMAPMAPGIRIFMSTWPMPSTNGVYSPRGISSVEKLIPGAMTPERQAETGKTGTRGSWAPPG